MIVLLFPTQNKTMENLNTLPNTLFFERFCLVFVVFVMLSYIFSSAHMLRNILRVICHSTLDLYRSLHAWFATLNRGRQKLFRE